MGDDDLDLELEDTPSGKPPAKEEPAHKPAQATAARRPGLFSRLGSRVVAPIEGVKRHGWPLRTFLYGLLILVILVILAQNWAPERFYFLGFRFELPGAVAFILSVALGFLIAWLWLRRPPRAEPEP